MNQVKRETAIICRVDDLLKGNFVKAEGWSPSYLVTHMGNISRVNIIGVIVSRDEQGVTLDDGSGKITLRAFEGNRLSLVNVGDLVLVIGRPRAYNEQKYVVVEIVRKIDAGWADFRKRQLDMAYREPVVVKQETRVVVSETVPNFFQKIMEFIKDLDSGDGADVEVVLKRLSAPNGEELVRKLIEEGEIFEIKPGRLKLLE